ncbi:uncharacterized protein LOC122527099 [Frieseomelitta varia]|uniref:uncharacterized protein LOC122527099 n=1 Tax=Frieseomelitta varia TaxID=561572 RepID=UPI001CB69750|nr:uncharacterized protein LOC122527099 [Frieseomelitta varia]
MLSLVVRPSKPYGSFISRDEQIILRNCVECVVPNDLEPGISKFLTEKSGEILIAIRRKSERCSSESADVTRRRTYCIYLHFYTTSCRTPCILSVENKCFPSGRKSDFC